MLQRYLLLALSVVASSLASNANISTRSTAFIGPVGRRPGDGVPKLIPNRLNYNMNNELESGCKKMKDAELVEEALFTALEEARSTHHSNQSPVLPQLFPSVRQCNAAIATFGDAGDFRRALILFTQMRKSVSIIRRMSRSSNNLSSLKATTDKSISQKDEETSGLGDAQEYSNLDLVEEPPAPTLVTYSTLMSRAVSVGKPRVAIRLWNLMKNQPNFYTNVVSRKQRHGRIPDPSVFLDPNELRKLEIEHEAIVPDVIFCNTLMNSYAKLGDHKMARFILNSMLGTSKTGNIILQEIPSGIVPTVVTYNTLADACKEAGNLAAGLEVLELMSAHEQLTGENAIFPDARTYTILISTVARKAKHEHETRDGQAVAFGERDPDKAFDLLYEMIEKGIKPNGVTYCALIDVCGRCRRVDLALNGLRIMLSSKKADSKRPLLNEVGAWTAAITACGKAGRIDTAIRLFDTMQKSFGVKPNAVTCGSLTDSLIKAGRITETLKVLQYMKQEGLVPGEVMYTSLMSKALDVARSEAGNVVTTGSGLKIQVLDKMSGVATDKASSDGLNTTNSIALYTELMRIVRNSGRDASSEDALLRVFLVFQEMKQAGITPDVASYNSLLRACAFAGDSSKAQEILRRMEEEDGLEPNAASWREALRAAAKEGRSDVADIIWNDAVDRKNGPFIPRTSDVDLLVSAYWREAQKITSHALRLPFYRKIIDLFDAIQSQSTDRGLNRISIEDLEQNQLLVLAVLRAAVSLVMVRRKGDQTDGVHDHDVRERVRARELACEIAGLDVLQGNNLLPTIDSKTKKALGLARSWIYSY